MIAAHAAHATSLGRASGSGSVRGATRARTSHTRSRHVAVAADSQSSPKSSEDWRAFRNALIKAESKTKGETAAENMELLKRQDQNLSEEDFWAHKIAAPEFGGLILASEGAVETMNDPRYWQLVIYLVSHSSQGSTGLVLNRPANFCVGNVDPDDAGSAFGNPQLYMGGIAQGDVRMMHGHPEIAGSEQAGPGVALGGTSAAAKGLQQGLYQQADFKFFIGCMSWRPGQLEAEAAAGVWVPAAASRALILKQCLGLPVPLWREVMQLMGAQTEADRAGEPDDE